MNKDIDINSEQANEFIKEYNKDFWLNEIKELVIGADTEEDFLDREIEMQLNSLNEAKQKGFGNDARVFQNNINILKQIRDEKYPPIKLQNQDKATPIEPIIWTGSNVLLGYLIQWLKDEGFISSQIGRDTLIKNHFVDTKGKAIKNIKQGLLHMKTHTDGSLPKDYEKIEPLLKTLKDLM